MILRGLPKMDIILGDPLLKNIGAKVRLTAAAMVLEEIRTDILSEVVVEAPNYGDIIEQILKRAMQKSPIIKRTINATGIVLHTNLGRAPMANVAAQAAYNAALGYCNLEYDLQTGQRGSRISGLEDAIINVTGTEAAVAVNNNAAAVLLTLSALCAGKEVIVSRGELVEIGGSFRVPEVIAQGGAILREVGTTNSTKIADYEHVIGLNTGALLKVHTSNYRIEGYTNETSVKELSELGRKQDIPTIYDLGGGSLVDVSKYEPTVQQILTQGADIICFSGDKLLGGPQAGIIIGKKDLIDKIRKHPLYRALRLDKMTLAALTATFALYEDEEQAKREIPAIAMLTASLQCLKAKAEQLLTMLPKGCGAEVAPCESQAGGGSLPGENFPSYAISISPLNMTANDIEKCFREHTIPVITRIHKDKILLDVRTINEADFGEVANAFACVFEVSL